MMVWHRYLYLPRLGVLKIPMDIRYVGTNIIANYIICYGILYHVYMIGAGNMYDVVTFSHIDISITDRTCHTIYVHNVIYPIVDLYSYFM